MDKLVEEMARDAKGALIGCRKCQGERTDWDELADAAAQACAAIAQKRVNELKAENARLKLLVRAYVDPFEVKADMLPLVKAINAEFDALSPPCSKETVMDEKPVLAIMRSVIVEANNSLYGSQGFFLTTADGSVARESDTPDKYHLARPIEALKATSRAAWRALQSLENGHANNALDTLRAALRQAQSTDVGERQLRLANR